MFPSSRLGRITLELSTDLTSQEGDRPARGNVAHVIGLRSMAQMDAWLLI